MSFVVLVAGYALDMTTTPFEPAEERDEESPDPGSGAESTEPEEVPESAAGQGEPVEPPD